MNFSEDYRAWAQAGFTSGDGSGLLGGPAFGRWELPAEVAVADGHLRWAAGRAWIEGGKVRSTHRVGFQGDMLDGLLDAFLELDVDGAVDPELLMSVVESWGPLNLCEHGATRGLGVCGCERVEQASEPLDAWTREVRRARAALAIAAEVTSGRPGRTSDWTDLFPGVTDLEAQGLGHHLATDRIQLAFAVNRILSDPSAVRSRLDFLSNSPRLGGWAVSLLGGVWLQVAGAITRTDPLRCCSACGRWHHRDRRTPAGRRAYCADCVAAGKSQRDARQDHRHGRGARRRSYTVDDLRLASATYLESPNRYAALVAEALDLGSDRRAMSRARKVIGRCRDITDPATGQPFLPPA